MYEFQELEIAGKLYRGWLLQIHRVSILSKVSVYYTFEAWRTYPIGSVINWITVLVPAHWHLAQRGRQIVLVDSFDNTQTAEDTLRLAQLERYGFAVVPEETK